jgi:hypothetical protein
MAAQARRPATLVAYHAVLQLIVQINEGSPARLIDRGLARLADLVVNDSDEFLADQALVAVSDAMRLHSRAELTLLVARLESLAIRLIQATANPPQRPTCTTTSIPPMGVARRRERNIAAGRGASKRRSE